MNAVLRYRCAICRGLHTTSQQAKKCCEPYAREVWVCGTCDKEHILASSAGYCCSEEKQVAA